MSNTSATGGFLRPLQAGRTPAAPQGSEPGTMFPGDATASAPQDAGPSDILESVEDVLHDLIAGITGLPGAMVRPRAQAEPANTPGKNADWCAFGVMSSTPYTYPQIKHYGEDGGYDDVIVHEELAVLASFYGPRHYAFAALLHAGLHVPQNREILRPNGLAFVKAGGITRLPELVMAGFRARADLPLTFRRVTARSYAVRNIEKSSGTLENDNGLTVGFGCGNK